MIELGELEKHHQDFESRNVRVVVVSNDDQALSQKTKEKCPHLVVVSDAQQNVAKAMQVIHPGMGHDGGDTNAPTTFLVDGNGTVKWLFRPSSLMTRLSSEDLLMHVDEVWPKK
jgi:peroxiredoxin